VSTAPLNPVDQLLVDAPGVAGGVLAGQDPDRVADWFEEATTARAVRILRLLDASTAARLLLGTAARRRADIVAMMEPRDMFRFTRALAEDERATLLEQLPEGLRREVNRVLAVPEDCALALMDVQAIRISRGTPVAVALDRVRETEARLPRTLYVIDDDERLAGMVDLQLLLAASGELEVGQVMRPVRWRIEQVTRRDEIAAMIGQYNLNSLPVVDTDGVFLGVIRSENLFDAVEEDALKDLQTMVGAGKDESALSSAWYAVQKRHPWLQINVITAFLAASVVGLFESTIAQFTALAVLMPVVAGQSGNTGAQALAVTMRGLALREIGINGWPRVLRKEASTGLLNGIGVATVCAIGVLAWRGSLGLALVIWIAMLTSMTIAAIAGALIPLTMARFGQDPATSSTILLTTVTDVMGFFTFLGTATALSFLL
jgi:magnesium transporter